MLIQRLRNFAVILAAALVIGGCHRPQTVLSVDPNVTFAAHLGRQGLAMDLLPGGEAATLKPRSWVNAPGAANYVLEGSAGPLAALWQVGASRVLVRREPSTLAPGAGEVLGSWDDNAIRLTLYLPDGSAVRSDVLAREGGGTGPSRLSRTAQTVIDVRGTYRGELRDAQGGSVGWLRVRVGPYLPAPRLYDGVLPAGAGPGLAAAVAISLDTEVTWIEDHSIDVYRGPGGSLERSFPW